MHKHSEAPTTKPKRKVHTAEVPSQRSSKQTNWDLLNIVQAAVSRGMAECKLRTVAVGRHGADMLLRITPQGEVRLLQQAGPDVETLTASMLASGEIAPLEDTEVDVMRRTLVRRNVENVMKGTRWLKSADLPQVRQAKTTNPSMTITRWIDQGRIFAIESAGGRLIPAYALDELGEPVPALQEVLSLMEDQSPFMIASWFEGPNTHLDGRRPRELLATHGRAVSQAVKPSLSGPEHG